MIRLLVVFGIIILIALVLIAFIFRHEIQTLAYKYALRDELKQKKHELRRKENKLSAMKQNQADAYERLTVEIEIQQMKNLIEEMEKTKNE